MPVYCNVLFFPASLLLICVLYYIRFVYVCFLSLHCTNLDCFLIYIVDFLLYFVRIIMYISLFSSILDMYTITISLSYLLILQLTDYIFFMVVATEIVRSKPAFAMQMCDHLSWSEHAGFFHCCIFMFGVEYIHIMHHVHFCLVKFDVCM